MVKFTLTLTPILCINCTSNKGTVIEYFWFGYLGEQELYH
jgi:hypothetical protein